MIFTHKYLQDYYVKHGPEEFIKFCNTENEKKEFTGRVYYRT